MSLIFKYGFCIMICLLLSNTAIVAQSEVKLKGTVLSIVDNEPMTGASIYINGTTIGTFVDENGNFELPYDPLISEIVISYIGYKTLTYKILPAEARKRFKFLLEEEAEVLQTVNITAQRSSNWENNLDFFIYHFIGNSSFAEKTKLLNPEVMYFEIDSTTNAFIAHAREPLQIENEALGYRIDYDLVKFEHLKSISRTHLLGYSKFTQLEGSKSKIKKWARNKKASYEGSFTHFTHSLQRDMLTEVGFEIKEMKKCPNPDRATDAQIDSTYHLLDIVSQSGKNLYPKRYRDSLETIIESRHLDETKICIDSVALDPTSNISKTDDGMTIQFDNYWQIKYYGGNMRKRGGYGSLVGSRFQRSVISLLTPSAEVDIYGQLKDPLCLLIEGYWIKEKMPYLLPLDYIIDQVR